MNASQTIKAARVVPVQIDLNRCFCLRLEIGPLVRFEYILTMDSILEQ